MFPFEVIQAPNGEWRVEHIRHDLEGQIEMVTFTGGRDEERAREFAALMNRRTAVPASKYAIPSERD